MKFFIAMRESVISFKFYDEIRRSRYGKVFGYLALLLLIVYTLSGVKTYLGANIAIDEVTRLVKNETPEFSISNGKLQWGGEPLHYFIDENGTMVAVDIDGALNPETLRSKYSNYFVFREDTLLMRNNARDQAVMYKDFGTDFSKQDVLNLSAVGKTGVVILIVLFFPFYYGYKLLNVVILAAMAAITASILKVKITWKENFIISGFALTLPMLLALLFSLTGVNMPWIAYWAISLVYVTMALRMVRTTEMAVAAAGPAFPVIPQPMEAPNPERKPEDLYTVSDGTDVTPEVEEQPQAAKMEQVLTAEPVNEEGLADGEKLEAEPDRIGEVKQDEMVKKEEEGQ